MEMIKTQDLAFTYPGTEDQVNTRALRGVDVTIERGSFVVILGHNGSGKSTLAKTFNAVLLPSGGKVYVEGMDTMDESLLLEIRRRVGMVFQNPDNQIVANVVKRMSGSLPRIWACRAPRSESAWTTRSRPSA